MKQTEMAAVPDCRLYLISPPHLNIDAFAPALEAALAAGDVACFQLRLKEADDAIIISAARALLPLCRARGVAFIMNDRADLCVAVDADGLHVGQEDIAHTPISALRATIGEERVIGVSAHDSLHLAMDAGEAGADYVAFGAFHPTRSKSPEKLAKYGTPTPDILTRWSEVAVLSCVAIGGMNPQNCGAHVEAGADFIAAINAVWEHPISPSQAVIDFNAAIAEALRHRPQNAA